MVVNVKDFKKKLIQKEKELLTSFENHVDSTLKEKYEGKTVKITLPGCHRKFLEKLSRLYQNAGWIFTYEYSPPYGKEEGSWQIQICAK